MNRSIKFALQRTSRVARGLLFSSSLVVSSLPAAEDWPEFRGPSGQGDAGMRRLPTTWSASNNVAWKQSVPGHGWSSPVLKDGRLYLTSAIKGDGKTNLSLQTLCFDASTGKPLWNAEVFSLEGDGGYKHEKNSHASPTPLVEDGRIYVHFGHHGTACLDVRGKIIWRNSSLSYPAVHGSGGSPIIVGNALIFSCEGWDNPFVVALNKLDGKVIWKTVRETSAKRKFSFSTPLLIQVAGQSQVISPGSGVASALDPKTGREIWRVRYGDGYSIVPRPVYGNGLVFIDTGWEVPSVLAIRPDGEGDVTDTHIAWTLKKGAPQTPSMLLVGDEIYMVSDAGIASCVDAKSGAVHWQERVGGNYSSSPIHAHGLIYFQNEEGKCVVVKAGKAFEIVATNDLGERTLASYAASADSLFIRTESHLYKITL